MRRDTKVRIAAVGVAVAMLLPVLLATIAAIGS
jgi:hypothetical protein